MRLVRANIDPKYLHILCKTFLKLAGLQPGTQTLTFGRRPKLFVRRRVFEFLRDAQHSVLLLPNFGVVWMALFEKL